MEKSFCIKSVFHSGQYIASYTGVSPNNSSRSSHKCSFIFGHLL